MSFESTSKVKTQIISREPPEREVSSVEIYSSNSDSEITSDSFQKDITFSKSSILSEGWCRSVLGKPCAKVRIYSQDFNPSNRKEKKRNDQVNNFTLKKPENQQRSFRPENISEQVILTENQSRESSGTLPDRIQSPENSFIQNPEFQSAPNKIESRSVPNSFTDNHLGEQREILEKRTLSPENSAILKPENRQPSFNIENSLQQVPSSDNQSGENSKNHILSPEKCTVKLLENQEPSTTESSLNQVPYLPQSQSRESGETLKKQVPFSENSQEGVINYLENEVFINSNSNRNRLPVINQPDANNKTETQDIEIGLGKTPAISKERDKSIPILNSEERRIPKNQLRKLICYCDEQSQTTPPSILKKKAISKSDPVFFNRKNKKTWTGKMDRYPEKEFSPQLSKDSQKIILTSDKVQQTSDDLLLNIGKNTASNTDRLETTNTSINTFNSESVRVQTVQNSSTSAEEECQVWHSGLLCKCSPPRIGAFRHDGSLSSPSVSPRTVESYRSGQTTASRKFPAKYVDIRDTLEEREYRYCASPYIECPTYPCQQALRNKSSKPTKNEIYPVLPKPPTTPSQRMVKVVPCDGSCKRCPRKPESCNSYQPVPFRPPEYTAHYETSSSDERIEDDEEDFEEDDSDGYTSEGSRKHPDLPYQNNEEYLELVQELEETLQSRNRNRVHRAMKEFEYKSKYNRPLERPIINYGEASESEEPIMRKISELTEKRRLCKGDCCPCRKGDPQNRQAPQPPRMKPQTVKTWNSPKPTLMEQTRWQMDKNSGEWFKTCQNLPKHAVPPGSLSPKREPCCGCSCSCGK
nr:uncharacterized protein LOC111510781 isoform X2 [Leptinotarsa decemlineata]